MFFLYYQIWHIVFLQQGSSLQVGVGYVLVPVDSNAIWNFLDQSVLWNARNIWKVSLRSRYYVQFQMNFEKQRLFQLAASVCVCLLVDSIYIGERFWKFSSNS